MPRRERVTVRKEGYWRRHLGLCAAQRRSLGKLQKRALAFVVMSHLLPHAHSKRVSMLFGLYFMAKHRELGTRIASLPMHLVRRQMSIDDVDDASCLNKYKFRKMHLKVLMRACGWGLEDIIDIGGHYGSINAQTAFLFMLSRFMKGTTNVDAALIYGIHPQTLGVLFNLMANSLRLIALPLLRGAAAMAAIARHLPFYNSCVKRVLRKYGPLPNTRHARIGLFVDGNNLEVCTPDRNKFPILEDLLFSAKDKFCALGWLVVSAPNGIIVYLPEVEPARRSDQFRVHAANLNDMLRDVQNAAGIPAAQHILLCGDAGFTSLSNLVALFSRKWGHILTQLEIDLNAQLRKMRWTNESAIGDVENLCMLIATKRRLKVMESPVATWYECAVLLSNFHTCLYGNKIADWFDCDQPTLREYTGNASIPHHIPLDPRDARREYI